MIAEKTDEKDTAGSDGGSDLFISFFSNHFTSSPNTAQACL